MHTARTRQTYNGAGLGGLVAERAYRLLGRAVCLCGFEAMTLRVGQAIPAAAENGGVVCRFLDDQEIQLLAMDASYQLKQGFVDELLAHGDRCLAVLDGEKVASFTWYSSKPTRVTNEFALHFEETGLVYMHKGFTHADYRGRRLYGLGIQHALTQLAGAGAQGLIALVELNNRGARRAMHRLGYVRAGRACLFGRLGHYVSYGDAGWRAERLSLRPRIAVTAHHPLDRAL
jgi:hypothetical protein